jgi:hypothetical protein
MYSVMAGAGSVASAASSCCVLSLIESACVVVSHLPRRKTLEQRAKRAWFFHEQ